MAKSQKQPHWLTRLVVDAVHHDQIRAHGGLAGVRDENALESALARPRQRRHDAADADLASLAAAYAFGLARNHPYRDGNKRIAFLAMVIFLDINGVAFDTSESEVVTVMLRLADGTLTEQELADWIRGHTMGSL